jgi:septum formation protein
LSANLILASASKTRRDILAAAGVAFKVQPAQVDEEEIKDSLLGEGANPSTVASALAEKKAKQVSADMANALILGADQVLVCDGHLFSKADDMAQARETLKRFRGRQHELISAMALVRDEITEWIYVESAQLYVRDFSDTFLDNYLEQEGKDVLGSVGCYRIEGGGAQLFEKVTGDQFTIRGFPLFPLLGALRARGIVSK